MFGLFSGVTHSDSSSDDNDGQPAREASDNDRNQKTSPKEADQTGAMGGGDGDHKRASRSEDFNVQVRTETLEGKVESQKQTLELILSSVKALTEAQGRPIKVEFPAPPPPASRRRNPTPSPGPTPSDPTICHHWAPSHRPGSARSGSRPLNANPSAAASMRSRPEPR